MAPETLKLNVERHGTKIRYKRQYKSYRWKSKSYEADTRENKREAWAAFVEWRSARLAISTINPGDPLRLHRELVSERFKTLAEHAELTADPSAKRWREALDDRFTSLSARAWWWGVGWLFAVGAGWVEEAFEGLGAGVDEGLAVLGLAAGLVEGSRALQRLAGVGPAVGVSANIVIFVNIIPERGFKLLGRREVAIGQELSS